MAGNRPEEQVRFPMVHQGWRHVGFLHWRYDPEVVQRLLPPELAPDLVDGAAWVALTPFVVEGFRPPGLPALPVVSRYPETNLRTYVRDRNGHDGLWFLSIEAESLPTVVAARLGMGIPYFPARMRVRPGDVVRYDSSRLAGRPARHRVEIRPGAEIGDDLPVRESLLLGRWRAYGGVRRCLLQVPVEHPPWAVRAATLVDLDESLTRAAGLPPPDHDPVVHYSDGVDVRLGFPRLVRAPSGR